MWRMGACISTCWGPDRCLFVCVAENSVLTSKNVI